MLVNLFYLSVRKFQWFDQSDLGYKNWEVSSELSPINTCVALHLSTGKWIKVSCADDPQYGVVCQAPGGKRHLFVAMHFVLFCMD